MKARRRNRSSLTALLILTIVNLLVLLFLKYFLNGLLLTEFRIDYIGNILDVAVTILFLIGLGIFSYKKKTADNKKVSLLLSFQILIIISYVLIVFVEKANFINLSGYLFGFPIKKVYVGFLFISGELLQLYSLIYVWSVSFGAENLIGVRAIVRTAALVILLLVFSLSFVWNVRAFSEKKIEGNTFEYGCVPGAAVWSHGKPSPIFEGRIRKTLDLYRKEKIKKIILTGGRAPGEISESEAAFNYLVNLEVPKEIITLETQSSTTTDQIKFLRTSFFDVQKEKPILVISDGFHLSRIIQISKFFKVNTVGVASDHSLSVGKTLFYRARESVALLLFWFFAI
ncbi:MAG: YdcF family protein [Bacteroidetes bacterium]|nr:YdcF family protein [Bacteroidota bacterium]